MGADELRASATHPGIAAQTTTAEVNKISIINAVAAQETFVWGFAALTFFAATLTGIGEVGRSARKVSTTLVSGVTGSAGFFIFDGAATTTVGIAGERGFLTSEILTGCVSCLEYVRGGSTLMGWLCNLCNAHCIPLTARSLCGLISRALWMYARLAAGLDTAPRINQASSLSGASLAAWAAHLLASMRLLFCSATLAFTRASFTCNWIGSLMGLPWA